MMEGLWTTVDAAEMEIEESGGILESEPVGRTDS